MSTTSVSSAETMCHSIAHWDTHRKGIQCVLLRLTCRLFKPESYDMKQTTKTAVVVKIVRFIYGYAYILLRIRSELLRFRVAS